MCPSICVRVQDFELVAVFPNVDDKGEKLWRVMIPEATYACRFLDSLIDGVCVVGKATGAFSLGSRHGKFLAIDAHGA